MIYYTSDLHFGHKNIIQLTSRPFSSVEEMDEVLIKNWNNKVTKNDLVYILGDFTWYNSVEKNLKILERLNGTKHLILGNHDPANKIKPLLHCFNNIVFPTCYEEIHDSGNDVVLCHYPIEDWNCKFHRFYSFTSDIRIIYQ